MGDDTKPCVATYKVFSLLKQEAPLNQIKMRIGCEGELLSSSTSARPATAPSTGAGNASGPA